MTTLNSVPPLPSRRDEVSILPVRYAELAREGRWAQFLLWLADRQHLLEVDTRLLGDVGLTRDDVRRGTLFRSITSRPAALASVGHRMALVLISKQLEGGAFRRPSIIDGAARLMPLEFAALFDDIDGTLVQSTKRIPAPGRACVDSLT